MISTVVVLAAVVLQQPVPKDSAFFRKGDAYFAVGAVAATAATAVFDERVARWRAGHRCRATRVGTMPSPRRRS
jgi:hypothetical protein